QGVLNPFHLFRRPPVLRPRTRNSRSILSRIVFGGLSASVLCAVCRAGLLTRVRGRLAGLFPRRAEGHGFPRYGKPQREGRLLAEIVKRAGVEVCSAAGVAAP